MDNIHVKSQAKLDAIIKKRDRLHHPKLITVSVELCNVSITESRKEIDLLIANHSIANVYGVCQASSWGDTTTIAHDSSVVFAGHSSLTIADDRSYVAVNYKSVVVARGSSVVASRDIATVFASENARVLAAGTSKVYASGNVKVWAFDKAKIYLSENARVIIFGENVTVIREKPMWGGLTSTTMRPSKYENTNSTLML